MLFYFVVKMARKSDVVDYRSNAQTNAPLPEDNGDGGFAAANRCVAEILKVTEKTPN